MSDEVKEILEDNGELMVRYKDNSFECFDALPKNVLDYITNLQQTYEKAIKQSKVDHIYASQKEDEAIDYKSRIDKAIEYIKVCKNNDMGIRYQRIEEILQGSEKE